MSTGEKERHHAGELLQDLCRACKTVRNHTVVAADADGRILRVICDYCGSQHLYRGGGAAARVPAGTSTQSHGPSPLPAVTERERRYERVEVDASGGDMTDIEMLLRRVIREEAGLTPVPIAERWRNGEMILKPGREGLQPKSMPIDTLFHKIVMLRNRLRVLEQQVNAAEIPEDLKLKLQGYITGCYGTLTSFNVLFAEEEDRFHGTGGEV